MQIDELASFDVDIEEIKYHINKFKNGQNIIVVTGEFNSGKSSFINCYLNHKGFLPTGQTECTPVLIDISEGSEELIEVRRTDGKTERVDYSAENILKYAKYDENAVQNVVSISVPVLNSGLPKGVHLIDTPGTNTILKEHEKITNYIIKKADVVLYLFNRVIAQTDISHIVDMYRYTNNVIYVMTHSDEIDNKTGVKYSDERIDELMAEAKKEISKGTGIENEDILMYAVGSIEGFDNRIKIDEILNVITNYEKKQTTEKRKRITQKKIESIIKKTIDNFSLKKELLRKEEGRKKEEIERKINQYKYDQDTYERKYENSLSEIDRLIERNEETCKDELSHLLVQARQNINIILDSSEYDEKNLEKQVDNIYQEISNAIRAKIERTITDITEKAYESVNSDLTDFANEFEISLPLTLTPPVIEELNDSRLLDKLSCIEKELEQTISDLEVLSNNSQSEKKNEIQSKIRKFEQEKEAISDNLLQLGAYKPEYKLVEKEGGRNAGKVTGRVIGEIADMALLIWNPAGAAAGAAKGAETAAKVVNMADKAKDTATIFRYVKNAVVKVKEAEKETDKKKETAKKMMNVVKDVDNARREMIDNVQENAEKDGTDHMTLSVMLDMLSIGHWTEKLGGAVGEAIKPTQKIEEEDLEHKAEYEKARAILDDEFKKLASEIYCLKNELSDIDDFGKQCRMEQTLKEKEKALEEKRRQIEKLIQQKNEDKKSKELAKYINSVLDDYEQTQKLNGERLIHTIFEEAKLRLVERITSDYYERVSEFRDMIIDLSNNLDESESKIAELEQKIETLSNSVNYVGMWLE